MAIFLVQRVLNKLIVVIIMTIYFRIFDQNLMINKRLKWLCGNIFAKGCCQNSARFCKKVKIQMTIFAKIQQEIQN